MEKVMLFSAFIKNASILSVLWFLFFFINFGAERKNIFFIILLVQIHIKKYHVPDLILD